MDHAANITFLKEIPRETFRPTETAKVLGGNPYVYNVAAKEGTLTLPFIWHGKNLRIFKQPILDILEGKAS